MRFAFPLSVTFLVVGILAVLSNSSWADDAPVQKLPVLSSMLHLATNTGVAKELELSPEQSNEIEQLMIERKEVYNEYVQDLRNRADASRTPEERRKRGEKMDARMLDIETRIEKVLLPHQLNRFRQLVFQVKTKAEVTSFGALSPQMIAMLMITDDQIVKISAVAQSHEMKLKKRLAEVRLEIEEMQRNAQQDIVGQLTQFQREEYQRLYGAPFTFENVSSGKRN